MENSSPPPGGDVNRGTTFIVLTVVFSFLTTITTVLRISIRLINRQLGWDDFTIAISAILVLIQLVFVGLQYHTGLGRHSYYLGQVQAETDVKWTFFTIFFLFLILCTSKIAICLFVLRIKKTRWLKWFLYSLMVGLVVTALSCEAVLFAQCQPVRAYWDRTAGTCWNPKIYNKIIWVQVCKASVSS